MRLKPCLMLLALLNFVAGCASPGDFCDVSSPAYLGTDAVAVYIHDNDPAFEEWILEHNLYGAASCGW